MHFSQKVYNYIDTYFTNNFLKTHMCFSIEEKSLIKITFFKLSLEIYYNIITFLKS